MLIPLGFLDFPTATGASSFDLLQTYTLASSQSSVTFSSLGDYAATYQHLQIRMTGRTDRASQVNDETDIQFNGDTANNYSWHRLEGYGSVASAAGTTTPTIRGATTAASNATASAFSGAVIDILDPFETTKYTTTRTLGGFYAGGGAIQLVSGSWRNTAALTSILLKPGLGTNWVSGSRFSLYGLKAA